MPATLQTLKQGLEVLRNGLSEIQEDSKSIGGLADSPTFRSRLHDKVRTLLNNSKQTKTDLEELTRNGEPGIDDFKAQFEQISQTMHTVLPDLIKQLKETRNEEVGTTQASAAVQPGANTPLLDQTLIDNQADQLDNLEQEVNEILNVMRELNQTFKTVFDEISKQRHILTAIDNHVANATEDMGKGNVELETAKQHQSTTTKTICIILIVVIVVALGVGLAVYLTTKKKTT